MPAGSLEANQTYTLEIDNGHTSHRIQKGRICEASVSRKETRCSNVFRGGGETITVTAKGLEPGNSYSLTFIVAGEHRGQSPTRWQTVQFQTP